MISGTNITLRAPLDEDLPTLMGMRNDLELQRNLLSVPRPNTMSRVKQWLERRLEDERGLFFIIAHSADNHAVGFIQIVGIDWVHQSGKLGLALIASARGKGWGTEAMTLCENYAAQRMGLRKIVLEVLASNTSAIKTYNKLGYRTIGEMKEHFFVDGVYHSVILMEKMLAKAHMTPAFTVTTNQKVEAA
jgi:RimJ/RimL family protein N-acetyltransferase